MDQVSNSSLSERDSRVGLRIIGLNKQFAGTPVLKDVSLEFRRGEIVGLAGPNGAGKSTLIKILDGIQRASSGRIEGVGRDRDRPNIAVVHQDLALIPELSILENLRMGQLGSDTGGALIRWRTERQAARRALTAVDLDVSLDEFLGELPMASQALVAVARALSREAEVLVLDETTASMRASEARWLLAHIRSLALSDLSVIVVSHRLQELLDVSDRIVVLVDGRVVADSPAASMDRFGLAALMSDPGAAKGDLSSERSRKIGGPTLLELRDVVTPDLDGVSLTVEGSVIVGVTGSDSAGLFDLAMVAAGIHSPSSGHRVLAEDIQVGLIPVDRSRDGVFPELDLICNASVTSLRKDAIGGGLRSLRRERLRARGALKMLDVKARGPDIPIRELSGGNQQKVLIARMILEDAHVLVLCEPTRGVDVRTRAEIYSWIRDRARSGSGILLITADEEELRELSDVVLSLDEGRIRPWIGLRDGSCEPS